METETNPKPTRKRSRRTMKYFKRQENRARFLINSVIGKQTPIPVDDDVMAQFGISQTDVMGERY